VTELIVGAFILWLVWLAAVWISDQRAERFRDVDELARRDRR
jgi:hypothetical protein